MEENEKKNCPFCGEEIDINTEKCPHCDEILTNVESKEYNTKIEQGKEIAETLNAEKSYKKKNFFKNNYMKILCGIIVIIAIFFLCSYKYKVENTEGNVYLVNQITGSVKLLEGSQIKEMDTVRRISEFEKKQLSQFKELDSQSVSGKNITCNLKYLWRNGKLYYTFSATPYKGDLEKNQYGQFTILLQDKNNFTIAEIPVYINNMSRRVDDAGKPYELDINDFITIEYDEMKLIDHWQLSWKF